MEWQPGGGAASVSPRKAGVGVGACVGDTQRSISGSGIACFVQRLEQGLKFLPALLEIFPHGGLFQFRFCSLGQHDRDG